MRKLVLIFTAASLLVLAGCATQTTSAPKAAEATTKISADAQAALDAAKAAVKDAKAKGSLWTTADSALKAAEEAAAKGDSDGVIKNAKAASDHARLGLEQQKYPALQLKDL